MNLLRSLRNRIGFLNSAGERYHLWYYYNRVWERTTWMGVTTHKSPQDMWNYQEIISTLRPGLLIEFGTRWGGSALFFASVLRSLGKPFRVLSVDIDHAQTDEKAKKDPDIELLTSSSREPAVAARIRVLREQFPGPVFAILDSDHAKAHVLAEMELLRPLLVAGDYLIVEDSNVNGHPVLPSFGPGPFEAINDYEKKFSNDYFHDVDRERKFGFTWAPNGFLVRK